MADSFSCRVEIESLRASKLFNLLVLLDIGLRFVLNAVIKSHDNLAV